MRRVQNEVVAANFGSTYSGMPLRSDEVADRGASTITANQVVARFIGSILEAPGLTLKTTLQGCVNYRCSDEDF